MVWFVAQVWVLCAIAFLLGAGVTWLLFVRPRRGEPSGPRRAVAHRPAVETNPHRSAPPEEPVPEPPPPTDPALTSVAGGPFKSPTTPGAGTRASGALDLLGVARRGAPPVIPSQAGPPDDGPATRGG